MLIMREILNPMFGMFKEYPESRMLWFSEMVSSVTCFTNGKIELGETLVAIIIVVVEASAPRA